ncbi:hypothetical protein SCP_1005520 [Sparassis crispa]|uniref:Uncharacterized protein n=1 Tax=Sparassis crispa TaxID=139825 RepID=A0A401GYR6_9APHY|nr:hypothetical protein SCP_1005520 [Sparassis crispa]GBE87304.1 hypothetical protein SCP_1005520 [Sparassis crispa]
MTKWLERREKVIHLAKYIIWRSHQAVSAENIIAVAYERRWEPPDMACALHQKMTRHPTRKGVDLELLASPSHYGATFFVPALARFIAQYNNPTLSIQQIEECAATIRFPFHSVPVFHKIKFWNEEVHGKETLDSIHAHPRIFDKDGDVVVPAPFDTALIQVRAARLEDLVGSTLQAKRVGQIRLKFCLCRRQPWDFFLITVLHLATLLTWNGFRNSRHLLTQTSRCTR